ncbi:hypothetical protein [Schaedlerella arabinosiphila]|jgi:SMC interacting uncharacterized protein involved in chromosome segregation|uniref:hypothetical protein n=1 Tax=Schaedlerella arabinosiphila TaxID=2044587 RepID=UPI001FAA7F15|nr:hypothetical protein [Schaedlerella arabinosiphila]
MIAGLLQRYPQFIPMYQQLYEICRNIERVMELYSEELRILDRNTVQLMIDEMQDEINEQKVVLNQKDEQLFLQEQQLQTLKQEIESLKKQLTGL